MTISNADEFNTMFPNVDKEFQDDLDAIDAAPEDAFSDLPVDPKLLGAGATPSRIGGKSVSQD